MFDNISQKSSIEVKSGSLIIQGSFDIVVVGSWNDYNKFYFSEDTDYGELKFKWGSYPLNTVMQKLTEAGYEVKNTVIDSTTEQMLIFANKKEK